MALKTAPPPLYGKMCPPRLNILGFGGVRVRVVITRFRDKNEVFVLFIIYLYIY